MSVKTVRRVIVGAALVVAVAAAYAGELKPAINKSGEVAIKGYDMVAYTTGTPARGDARFAYTWNGATWHFVSAANRDEFARQPEKYSPQFGGYCAWAVSRGYTADVDPEAWKIVDGRLYLNYSKSVQRRWEQDVPGNIQKAQANWPGVLAK